MTDNLVCVEKKVLAVSGLSRAARIRLHHSRLLLFTQQVEKRYGHKNGRNYNVNEILQSTRLPAYCTKCRAAAKVCVACVYRVKPAAM
jgi:hypothetical protein